MASIHGFSLKNRKSFMGREGYGDQGDIYYEGKKVGWYNNSADGGCADIDFYHAAERREECEELLKLAVEKYYNANPLTGEFKDLTPDAELFMCEILTLMDREKSYKKMAKKGYEVVITYLEKNGHDEIMAGFNFIENAKKHITEKNLIDAKIHTSLADFIIK